ncbi:LysR family transcriptional regulator [Xanthomonas hortorum]|uniref:LysR family transcriptional regulator n=1 Tax=Xanthomonas hortorum TaxID=56454 RepID=A0AA47EZ67_9XANT|nr:LysR family transcriptional regulator [Xanthomonas hortorum]WAH66372.1 LysR family transcriptional regulator [Xanthomonas hortorum]
MTWWLPVEGKGTEASVIGCERKKNVVHNDAWFNNCEQSMDKLTAMATFVKVVDTGSFTRAADALDLPKTRVSQRISDLEKHLGVRLLNRTTRALSLTDDGAAYFDKCKALLQQIDELESTLSGETAAPIGRLRVDSLVSIARWVIAPKLHDFQARYPRIQLRLSSSDRISHLLEDGIDCTIRGGALKDSSMIARHLCDIQMGLYASPDYLASVGGVDTPDALLQLKRISWFSGRERNPFVWELEAGHARFVLQSGDGMQFDEPDVAMSACMAGSGICPGAPFAVAGFVRSGRLVPVLPQWHFSPRPIHIVYPGSRHLSVRVRCFVNWILEVFAAHGEIKLTPIALAMEPGLSITKQGV